MTRSAAFFDVDETLVTIKSMFRFLRHYWRAVGRPESDYLDVEAEFRTLPQRGVTRSESNRRFYAQFAGDPVDQVARFGREWFEQELGSPDLWHRPGLEALRRHRAAGDLVVLVSGSFPPCLDPLAAHLRADRVLCSRPATEAGRYTGELAVPMIGEAKGDAVRQLLAEHGLAAEQCFAYADHASDLPLLEAVGHPCVVGSDPVLEARVRELGWATLAGV